MKKIAIWFCGLFEKKSTEKYTIKTSIKPFKFEDGLGSKYYVEVLMDGVVILSLSEGINYLTEEKKISMANKAISYIEKCKGAEL